MTNRATAVHSGSRALTDGARQLDKTGAVLRRTSGPNLTVVEAPLRIQEGTVLIKGGVRLPDSLHLRLSRFGGWQVVEGQYGFEVARKIEAAGSQFITVLPDVKASGLSVDPQRSLERAMQKLLESIEARGLNALEVREIVRGSFLGVHGVTVRAHSRQVQESIFLHEIKRFHWPRKAWGSGRIRGVRGALSTYFKGI